VVEALKDPREGLKLLNQGGDLKMEETAAQAWLTELYVEDVVAFREHPHLYLVLGPRAPKAT
jgi:hypothetical protein